MAPTQAPVSSLARSSAAPATAGSAATLPAPLSLRLLSTSDLHAQILPYDYYTDRAAPGTGLAQIANLIARLRAEVPGTLLFDNGDFLQGNLLGDFVATQACAGPHPVIAAMNALRYDAAALGNHEFNFGVDFLR